MDKNNNVLVSVIIPTYKRKDTLNKAIDSVLSQTYPYYEIIVVDDNGDDEYSFYVKDLCSSYMKKDCAIKLINYGKNMNGAYARNQGIINAQGKYISFLDDDDVYFKDKLALQVAFMESNYSKFDAVYCKMITPNSNKALPYAVGDLSIYILKQISLTPTPTLFFKRSVLLDLNGFDINLKRHQDYDLMLRFFEKYSIGFIDEFLVEQGRNLGENSLSGKKLEDTKLYFLTKFKSNIEKFPHEDQKEIYFINYFNVFFTNLKKREVKHMLKYFFKSFSISPIHFIQKTFDIIYLAVKK